MSKLYGTNLYANSLSYHSVIHVTNSMATLKKIVPAKHFSCLQNFFFFFLGREKLNNSLLCYLHWLASTATKRHVTHKYRGQTWMHAALLSFSALVFIPFDPHFVLQTKQYKLYKVSAVIETESGTNFFFFLGSNGNIS